MKIETLALILPNVVIKLVNLKTYCNFYLRFIYPFMILVKSFVLQLVDTF